MSCFILYCPNKRGANEDITFFELPKDTIMLDNWMRVIPTTKAVFTTIDYVCQEHFKEEDIIRAPPSDSVKLSLRAEAVPSIFPPRASRKRKRKLKKLDAEENRKDPLESEETAENSIEIKTEPDLCENIKLEESKNILSTELIIKEETTEDEIAKHKMFEDIWASKIKLDLSNRSWAIHFLDQTHNICLVNTEMSTGQNPLTNRHILIDDSFNIRYYFGNKEINSLNQIIMVDNYTQLKNTLETIIKDFELIEICSGGPSVYEYSKQVISTDYAFVDDSTWRHTKCPVILSENERNNSSCRLCLRLKDAFLAIKLKKSVNMNCRCTMLEQARKLRNNTKKQLLRSQRTNLKLRAEVKALRLECLSLRKSMTNKRISDLELSDTEEQIKEVSVLNRRLRKNKFLV